MGKLVVAAQAAVMMVEARLADAGVMVTPGAVPKVEGGLVEACVEAAPLGAGLTAVAPMVAA